MLQKVLIANRGEIALRILRACRDLGLPAVVAYSEADRDSLPVQLADEAVCIGPGPAAQSYLRRPAIITAAQLTGCDAIHPGYGFLAENAYMAQMCEELGITFIGPRAETIERMGDKAMARETMRRAGLPILPGLETPASNDGELLRAARRIGFPVMLKAAAGGGGRGMRVVRSEAELERVLPLARAEAEAAFSSGEMYVERFLESPRHIEVQILGDGEGKVALLGERDCSLQRRHQKLLEESPAPGLSSKQRQTLWDLAHKGTREIKYRGAGTLEFLMDGDGRFYFMEMNTRIQVEHPVYGGGHGGRSRRVAVAHRGGRTLDAAGAPSYDEWARHRVSDYCRRPGSGLRTVARHNQRIYPAGRVRRAGGQSPLRRLPRPAVLRFAARQGDCLGGDAR